MPKTNEVEASLKPAVDELRADLLRIEKGLRALRIQIGTGPWPPGESSPVTIDEMLACQELTLRHVEDARARLGRLLVVARDGVG